MSEGRTPSSSSSGADLLSPATKLGRALRGFGVRSAAATSLSSSGTASMSTPGASSSSSSLRSPKLVRAFTTAAEGAIRELDAISSRVATTPRPRRRGPSAVGATSAAACRCGCTRCGCNSAGGAAGRAFPHSGAAAGLAGLQERARGGGALDSRDVARVNDFAWHLSSDLVAPVREQFERAADDIRAHLHRTQAAALYGFDQRQAYIAPAGYDLGSNAGPPAPPVARYAPAPDMRQHGHYDSDCGGEVMGAESETGPPLPRPRGPMPRSRSSPQLRRARPRSAPVRSVVRRPRAIQSTQRGASTALDRALSRKRRNVASTASRSFYKLVAVVGGRFVSIFDGVTEYALHATTQAPGMGVRGAHHTKLGQRQPQGILRGATNRGDGLGRGCAPERGHGIYIYRSVRRALDSQFPERSALLGSPRALLRVEVASGDYWESRRKGAFLAARVIPREAMLLFRRDVGARPTVDDILGMVPDDWVCESPGSPTKRSPAQELAVSRALERERERTPRT